MTSCLSFILSNNVDQFHVILLVKDSITDQNELKKMNELHFYSTTLLTA